MQQETIAVIFSPISGFGDLFYHETLIYTNSDGVQYVAYAEPSIGGSVGDFPEGEFAALTGLVGSNWGTIETVQNVPLLSLPETLQTKLLGPPNAPFTVQTVDTGADLSAQWQEITQIYSAIGAAQLPYAPYSQNSNSAASTALAAAAIPLPNTGFLSGHWTPGSDNVLPVLIPPAITLAEFLYGVDFVTAFQVGGGAGIVVATDYNSAGVLTDQMTFDTGGTESPPGEELTVYNSAGVPVTTVIVNPTSGAIDDFVSDGNSDLVLDPSDNVTGVESDGADLKATFSQDLNGNPISVIVDPDGTYSLGLDPTTFDPAVNFAPDGLNGDTVDVAANGDTAIINTEIGDNASAEVSNDYAVAAISDSYTFMSNDGTLILNSPDTFLGTIDGFVPGDTIELSGIDPANGFFASAATLGADNLLTVQESDGGTLTLQLDPTQDYNGDQFFTFYDGSGTEITMLPAVQTSGTQTVTVDAPVTDPSTGETITYSASVSLFMTDMLFPTVRTDDQQSDFVAFTATYAGGDLNPNYAQDAISVDAAGGGTSPFTLDQSIAGLGPDNTSGTSDISSAFGVESGNYSDVTLPISVSYDGGSTTADLTVSQKVYAPAIAEFLLNGAPATSFNFGTIHIGQTVGMDVEVANTATGALADALSIDPVSTGELSTQSGLNVQAGSTGDITLDLSGDVAGSIRVLADPSLLGLVSHDRDLPDETAQVTNLPAIEGTVDYYANPVFVDTAATMDGATLTQQGNNWTLNLGTIGYLGVSSPANLEIDNATPSVDYSDHLKGSLDVSDLSGTGFDQSIINIGTDPGIPGGSEVPQEVGSIGVDSTALGFHTESIIFSPVSYNGSGFSEALPDETLTIMDDVACFLAGTRLSTLSGDMPVEALSIGDVVLNRLGGRAPIRWRGHRRVDCRRHPRPWDVWPARVCAGAFGEGQPRRDMFLSPDHAVFVDGVLIPVRYLINGATIVQEERDEVTYWHVELDRHDVILAEGLPCESYLDTGNRGAFGNGGPAVHMHPDFALRVWAADSCAPLVLDGSRLVAAKQRLLARATVLGHATTSDPGVRVLANGRELAVETDGHQWRVRLPEATENVLLTSRVWSPAHTRPAEDDTRSLGVAISRMWLDRREVSLESSGLRAGWHAPEPDWRWTAGDAELALTGVRELTFEVAMTGTYWRNKGRPEARAA